MNSTPSPEPTIPTFTELAADPEIALLLEFEPVAVRPRVNGWDPDTQRAYVAQLAITGSKSRAGRAIGRAPHGAAQLRKHPGSDGFGRACDLALAHYRRNNSDKLAFDVAAARKADPRSQAPGQVRNELGEWEDEASLRARAEDARDSIANKLRRSRRLYLREIAGSPGHRAAFELLTELPIDWAKAEALQAQPDEPWRRPNMRQPDMLLTAENGWLGDVAHGPDKKAQLRQAMDAHHAEHDLPPIDWNSESTERSDADA